MVSLLYVKGGWKNGPRNKSIDVRTTALPVTSRAQDIIIVLIVVGTVQSFVALG